MVVQHITWHPATCECIVEVQYDDAEPLETKSATLYFFHKICERHQPLVKNKKALSAAKVKKQREDIIKHHEGLLATNRERHLKTVDDHLKQKMAAADTLKKSQATEKHGLMIEGEVIAHRHRTTVFLDDHEVKSMDTLVTGLFSENALNAQEVYDAIMQEQPDV